MRIFGLVFAWLICHSFIHGEFANPQNDPYFLNAASKNIAVCLAENDGNPTRAMEALGERDIGKSMMMSMATAGLVGSGPTTVGLSTGQLITAYAKHELIKAAVNTMLVTTIDGQDFGKTLEANLKTAALSTIAAFGAHKIGDLLKPTDGSTPISGAAHKALHTALGAGIGAATAAVTGQYVTRGAVSGGFGALAGTLMTEAMADQQTTEQQAQRITQMSDFMTAALAFAVGLDPVFAYTASHNANEYNFLAHHRDYLQSIVVGGEEAEEELTWTDEADEPLTPRTEAGLSALRHFDRIKEQHPDFIDRRKDEGRTRENTFTDLRVGALSGIVLIIPCPMIIACEFLIKDL